MPQFGMLNTQIRTPTSTYHDFVMWQYSHTGKVNGIKTDVDMDILFEGKLDQPRTINRFNSLKPLLEQSNHKTRSYAKKQGSPLAAKGEPLLYLVPEQVAGTLFGDNKFRVSHNPTRRLHARGAFLKKGAAT